MDVYTVKKSLGKGSFCKVYLAIKNKDDKMVAIKSISKKVLRRDPRNLSALVKEIEVLRKVNHSNIVKLYEVYESDDHIRLTMEYIEGRNLMSYFKHQVAYGEKEVSLLFNQALDVLDYCHSRNIIHRDLKPENLMITYFILELIDRKSVV